MKTSRLFPRWRTGLLVLLVPGALYASGLISTKYNVFVPPNDDNNARHASLILTAIQDSTQVTVADDGADGDTDDSWSGILMKGQSYFIKIREGTVNDDIGGKQDGDFFKINSNRPVYVINMTTHTTWQHDFVPADNKMTGINFYLYAPDFNYDAPALCIFAYYGNTDVRLIDITNVAKTTTGLIAVRPDSLGIVTKRLFAVAGQHSDIIQLTAGHTYHIISSKDIALQYGALYYEGGPWGNAANARDGGAYVPARNGSKTGTDFYFLIPAQSTTREMRIISYKSNAHIRVFGTRDRGLTYTLITEFDLNQYDHKDLIASDLNTGGNAYYFFHVTATKNIAIFEGAWMETGDYGTSDMATSVSSEDGNSQGKRFTTYMAPPGNEPVGGVPTQTQLSHLYFYVYDTTRIEAYDIDSYGEYIELHNTTDSTVHLNGWSLVSNWGSCTFGPGDSIHPQDYFLLEYDERATNSTADFVWGAAFPTFRLANNDDRLILRNASNVRIDRIYYQNTWDHHGNHLSLEKKDPTLSSYNNASNWADVDSAEYHAYASGTNLGDFYGTPGYRNTCFDSGAAGTVPVAINEIMTGRIYRSLTVDSSMYGDVALGTAEWEAINNGDDPTTADPTEPEAPYLTVESDRLVSILNMNWNDNWLAYVGAIITPTPEISYTPDYYQRKPGKQVVFTLVAFNAMWDSLENVVTTITIPALMNYTPGSYTTPAYINSVIPTQVQNSDSSWTITWNHGGKGMANSSVEPAYIFTVTATVDSGLSDSLFLVSYASVKGEFDGVVYSRQDYANVLVGLEKSLSSLYFMNTAGETTEVFARGDSVQVSLRDDDENRNAFIRDTVRVLVYNPANQDSQQLVCLETGINTAVFTGAVGSSGSGSVINNDGILVVASRDTVLARYVDADDASDVCLAAAYILPIVQLKIIYPAGPEVGILTTSTDNDTLWFYAVGYDSLGNAYPHQAVAWFISYIGTVNPDTAESTNIILFTTGTGHVWAVHPDGAIDSTGLITVVGGRATGLAISPDTATGTTDDTLAFTVTGSDNDGNLTTDFGTLTWGGGGAIGRYLDSTGAAVTFSLNLVGADSLWVTSSYGAADTSGAITARRGALRSLTVVPDTARITTDSTVQFIAQARDADGNTWDVTDSAGTVWGTSDLSVSADSGRYHPDSTGTYRIWARFGGRGDTSLVMVRHGVAATLWVNPDSAALALGSQQQVRAYAADAAGIGWDITDSAGTVWGTDDASVSVTGGRYRPDSIGSYLVYATAAGRADTCRMKVFHGPPVSLQVTPSSAALTADSSLQFTATAGDSFGNSWEVTDSSGTSWQTDDAGGTVSNGRYEPVQAGDRLVWAVYAGLADTSAVTVTRGTLDSIAVIPPLAVLVRFSQFTFSLDGFDQDRNRWSITDSVTWSTTDTTGGIDTTGLYTAGANLGQFLVKAHYQALAGSSVVSIIADSVIHHISIEYQDGTPVGDTVLTTDNDTTTVFARWYTQADSMMGPVSVAWSVIGDPVGQVRSDPHTQTSLTLTRPGICRIVASYSGSIADTSGAITVIPGTVYRIRLDGHPTGLAVGETLSLRVRGYDRDNNGTPDSLIDPYLVWLGGRAIGRYLDSSGTVVQIEIVDIGPDTVIVRDTLRGLADTSEGLWATTDFIASIQIFTGGRDMVSIFETLVCSVFAFDSLGNRLRGVAAMWGYTGSMLGNFIPFQDSVTTWWPEGVGDGTIYANFYDHYFDTTYIAQLDVRVVPGPLYRVEIVDAGYQPVDSLSLTTDHDGRVFYALGYDSVGNSRGRVAVDWSLDHVGRVNPERADSTAVDFNRVGQGYLTADFGGGITDQAGPITVTVGQVARLEIIPSSLTMSAVDSAALYVEAFDADSNRTFNTGQLSWALLGGVNGSFSPITITSSETTTFRPANIGAGQITVRSVDYDLADTISLDVSTGAVHSIVIFNAGGAVMGDTLLTTDNDTAVFRARGYDARGNDLGLFTVAWSIIGEVIGEAVPDSAESTILNIDYTGTARLVAFLGAGIADTTGFITVTGGRAVVLEIRPDSARLTADDSLMLTVTGRDADGNITADLGVLDWAVMGGALTGGFIPDRAAGADTTHYHPVRTGQGRILVESDYGLTDTTGTITVTPGAPVAVDIHPAGPETLLINETVRFYALGFDRHGNFTDTLAVNWDTTGLAGILTSRADTTHMLFTAQGPGTGHLMAFLVQAGDTVGTDTVEILVLPYWIYMVDVVRVDTTRLDDTVLTVDDAPIPLWAAGYDTAGTFLKFVSVTWGLNGDPIGHLSGQTGESCTLTATTTGKGQVGIVFGSAIRGSTGTITVNPGRAETLSIVPVGGTVYAGDTLRFTVTGRDRYGNATTTWGSLSWDGAVLGSLTHLAGDTVAYVADTLGTDFITVLSFLTGAADTSGIITVTGKPHYFDIRVERTISYLGASVKCTLIVRDRFGNVVTGYQYNASPIRMEGLIKVEGQWQPPHGDPDYQGTGVTDAGKDGVIAGSTAFVGGRKVISLEYDAIGETLWVRFTEDSSGISGLSPGIVWFNPELISEIFVYPSPMDFNIHKGLKIDYVLKHDSKITFRIFGAEGSFIMEKVYKNEGVCTRRGPNRWVWNGLNRKGKKVASGPYVVKIMVETEEGSAVKQIRFAIMQNTKK